MMKHNFSVFQSISKHVRQISFFANLKSSPINNNKLIYYEKPSSISYSKFSHSHSHTTPNNGIKLLGKYIKQINSKRWHSNKVDVIETCWNCKKTFTGHLLCDQCGTIRDINTTKDYFALLGVEKTFSLNQTELTQKFRQLQTVVHPDKFSNKSETEQNLSAEWSSLINKAYTTLSVPIKRGEYMLNLKDVEIPEGNTAVDKEFLMEMMERNEEVDDANKSTELLELLNKVREDIQKSVAELEISLQENDLEKSKVNITTLRYLISLETSIKSKNSRLVLNE